MAALTLMLFAGCKAQRAGGLRHVGERRSPGAGQALLVAPGGSSALYLREPIQPKGPLMPSDLFLGELVLVPASGEPVSLGPGATNLAGDVLFSPDGGQVAFLRHFDFQSSSGELALAPTGGGAPRIVAGGVTFFGFSPDGRWLGDVASGRLEIAFVSGGAPRVVADGVSTFEFSADGETLLYRRRAALGGELVIEATDGHGAPVVVARQVADYRFDQKGRAIAYTLETPDRLPELHLWKAGRERLLGKGAPSFEFSPDGKLLAFVAGVSAHYLEGDLYAVDVEGGAAERVGSRAGAYRFAPDGRNLAFLDDYYDQSRTGKLELWRPGAGKATLIAPAVRLFGWSHRGAWLAFLETVTRPMYTERLYLVSPGAAAERRFVGQAIYSFDFSPDDSKLLFKAGCVAGGQACDLMAVDTHALSEGPPPLPDGGVTPSKATRVAAGIADYDYSTDGKWLWTAFMNPVGHTVDLAVLPSSGGWSLPRYVDRGVEPHPRWLADGRIAYLVDAPKRAGLYEADPAKAEAISVH